MKNTIKGFKAYACDEVAALIEPVKKQLGENVNEFFDTCGYVYKCGADSGFSHFIYYQETTAFYFEYRQQIVTLVEWYAREMGEDAVTMVKNFRCLNGFYEYSDIAKALYDGKCNNDYTDIYNALSWFALEMVASEAIAYMDNNK